MVDFGQEAEHLFWVYTTNYILYAGNYATTIIFIGLAAVWCGLCRCICACSSNHTTNVVGDMVFLTQFRSIS